ncbi:hypothetical protein ACFVR6_03625 [Microbacterium sp. NPDC058021]|uniref:hypothetical protein n=1 Tax=Microbacterium sp. NPDC058021 TaxID=3346306 RepID=UPI0036DD5D2D
MAITSVGYEGTIYEAQWAEMMPLVGGRQYGVAGPGDWRVTVGGADRQVRVAAGRGFGHGVLDNSSTETVLSLATVASGSRWDLVVARRNWGTNTTSFAVVTGSATRALPGGRAQTPGTLDEQPVALVRVQAGQSQVAEIVDLRVWGGDGGTFAHDALVMQYLSRVGTALRINGIDWKRIIDPQGNPAWVSSSPTKEPVRGRYEGPTSASGTVTVDHGLGVVPTFVSAQDTNSYAIPGQRKISFVVANETQIQFLVFNTTTGGALANNPIIFYWIAYP